MTDHEQVEAALKLLPAPVANHRCINCDGESERVRLGCVNNGAILNGDEVMVIRAALEANYTAGSLHDEGVGSAREALWRIGENPAVPDAVRNDAHAACASLAALTPKPPTHTDDWRRDDDGTRSECEDCEWRECMVGSGADAQYGCNADECEAAPTTTHTAPSGDVAAALERTRARAFASTHHANFAVSQANLHAAKDDMATITDALAETERLRDIVCPALDVNGEHEADCAALNDPAFIRVPRAVLEAQVRLGTEYADQLLRTYATPTEEE